MIRTKDKLTVRVGLIGRRISVPTENPAKLRVCLPGPAARLAVKDTKAVFNFLPKDEKFFDELDSLARMLVSAAHNCRLYYRPFPSLKTNDGR